MVDMNDALGDWPVPGCKVETAHRTGVSGSVRTHCEAALALAARGFAVFPVHTCAAARCSCGRPTCSSPGKHPRTKNGLRNATTDPEQIGMWWRSWPAANVGLLTGSGLLVLDIDPRNGGKEALLALAARYGELPLTPAATGDTKLQGGAMLFTDLLAWPEPVVGRLLLDELLRSIQAYVVLPEPSAVAVALWILHTHALDAAQISPRLASVSLEKRCGKSTVLKQCGSWPATRSSTPPTLRARHWRGSSGRDRAASG